MKGEGGGAPGGQVNGMPNKKSQSTSKLSAKGELQVYWALGQSKYIKETIIASVRSVSSFVCPPPPQLQIRDKRGWELYIGGGQ